MQYVPLTISCVIGAVLLYFLNRYRKESSIRDWYARVLADAEKARTDESFRRAQIVDAEAELAKHPRPDPILPIRGNQEFYLQALPTITMAFAGVGAVLIGLGLSKKPEDVLSSVNWTLYMGAGFLAICGFYVFMTEKAKKTLARVRQINRLNLLYKAEGNVEGVESTLRQLIDYYPAMTALKLELANQIALGGKVEEGVELLRKATASMKDDIDKALVDLSFYLSWGATDAAQEVVDRLPELSNLVEDARPDLYAAALELVRGNQEKARAFARKAVRIDSSYVDYLISRDPCLRGAGELVQEIYQEIREKGDALGEEDEDSGDYTDDEGADDGDDHEDEEDKAEDGEEEDEEKK